MPNDYHLFQNKISGKIDEIYDYEPVFDETGNWRNITGINVIIRSLRTLLMTPLGHYPFDPEYGSLLYKKIFEMSDIITLDQIRFEVDERVRRYDPRIEIESVNCQYTNDKKTALVNVVIKRGKLTGKIDVVLSSQKTMFGLEDEISSAWNK